MSTCMVSACHMLEPCDMIFLEPTVWGRELFILEGTREMAGNSKMAERMTAR